jgi:hypothetical protein
VLVNINQFFTSVRGRPEAETPRRPEKKIIIRRKKTPQPMVGGWVGGGDVPELFAAAAEVIHRIRLSVSVSPKFFFH